MSVSLVSLPHAFHFHRFFGNVSNSYYYFLSARARYARHSSTPLGMTDAPAIIRIHYEQEGDFPSGPRPASRTRANVRERPTVTGIQRTQTPAASRWIRVR